jgi:hypothetical protein
MDFFILPGRGSWLFLGVGFLALSAAAMASGSWWAAVALAAAAALSLSIDVWYVRPGETEAIAWSLTCVLLALGFAVGFASAGEPFALLLLLIVPYCGWRIWHGARTASALKG